MNDLNWPRFTTQLGKSRTRIKRSAINTVQINLGKLCNQACLHCHVEAGPNKRRENMNLETVERILELIRLCPTIEVVDITGGAPELNPHFRYLVESLANLGIHVIDRCNLTVLFESGQEDTAEFLKEQRVNVVASLPCYSRDNVEKQRGDGVFDKSIRALKLLNSLGYGAQGSGLKLDLVYNPIGPHLPPDQEILELEYKKNLSEDFGIRFNRLFTITNMPIKRFLFDLKKTKKYDFYMHLLWQNFNDEAASQVMCKSLVSIGWDGKIYDCDFNQMLEIPLGKGFKSIWELDSLQQLDQGNIALGDHCYGCTAGRGSSCGGSLS